MLAGIRDILIISTPQDVSRYKQLLGDGSSIGISLSYEIQEQPRGIGEAFIIAEDFIGNDRVSLILGDNIFYGSYFTSILQKVAERKEGATIFGYRVKDPRRFGVVEFDEQLNVVSIEEKPSRPKSEFAVTGLYFYDNDIIKIAKALQPSERGELEITDINREYLNMKKLKVELLGRGFAWLDAGTHESLLEASLFIETVERRQGLKVACLEEIAYRMGYIEHDQLIQLAQPLSGTSYGKYLMEIAGEIR